MAASPPFPNYLQLRERAWLPVWIWHVLRLFSVAAIAALIGLLLLQPDTGLRLMWGVLVPLLPLLFLTAPGLWRNLCPFAAVNQLPRLVSASIGFKLPRILQEYGYVLGFVLFFGMASARKWLFNADGEASAVLLLGLLTAAFIGGLLFQGKSGWCSSFCPMLPVQRMYNQTPFVTIANSHCTPCVGCTRNCYDFNPKAANLADLYDDDPYYSGYRKVFISAFPGFILGFVLIPNPPDISIPALYAQFAVFLLTSIGLFYLLDSFCKVSSFKLTTLYTAVAFGLFYWFLIPLWLTNATMLWVDTAPAWLQTATGFQGGAAPAELIGGLRAVVLLLGLIWIARSYRKEPRFLEQLAPAAATRVSNRIAGALRKAAGEDRIEISFQPQNRRMLTEPGRSLLEATEQAGIAIEFGCRLGVCGADPVVIVDGMSNLSPPSDDERSTLERLGLGANCRMACMARVHGPVVLTLDRTQAAKVTDATPAAAHDPTVQRLVILGHGIAGVTAADYARRRHPDCEIHLIGRESHILYNRMAISRLIYGRSAMQGLYLQPESWFSEHRIETWLNTQAAVLDPTGRQVRLATGESLSYDRLILTTGSRSRLPAIAGIERVGAFVLREADDAIALRAYTQRQAVRQAVVAGGGLLGLEAAYAIHKLGITVTVLERGRWLLRRQLDARCAELLQRYLEGLGIRIVLQAETAALDGAERVREVVLQDGRRLPCDLFLAAAGVQPNVELAQAAGLRVNQGVIVDAYLQTSQPDIYAAGDVCEFDGQVPGLWPVAVEQGKVAALNAVGGRERYTSVVPVTALKVAGIVISSSFHCRSLPFLALRR